MLDIHIHIHIYLQQSLLGLIYCEQNAELWIVYILKKY